MHNKTNNPETTETFTFYKINFIIEKVAVICIQYKINYAILSKI